MTAEPEWGRAYRYSRWDGTQKGFDLDADAILADLSDELLYHGDVNAALRRLLQGGLERPDGERLEGLRDMLRRARQARRERLERYDLGGPYAEVAQQLREVLDTERQALDRLEAESAASGDQRRQDVTGEAVAERRAELDSMPPDLAGQVQALQDYDFVSAEAQQRFDELVDKLRRELAQSAFRQMSGSMQSMTAEDLARMKDMLAALNDMLMARAAGDAVDFEGFMERFGDFFPENPQTLDELLEVMARRMAAAQAMFASMTPEQRAQLQALSDQLLDDMDLRWQVDQLSSQLQAMFPDAGWGRSYEFSGDDPLSMGQAGAVLSELGELDDLERMLSQASSPADLNRLDADQVGELLGPEAAQNLRALQELARTLEEAGLINNKEGRLELTPRGLRRLGEQALGDLFRQLTKDRGGMHPLPDAGGGHERTFQTRPWEWGDPFNLHIERTVRNALVRTGGGTPVRLVPDDFEIEETEEVARSATVVAIDLSLSMPMRGNWLPAKKVAMALHTLISSEFPRDYLGLVGFGFVGRTIEPRLLPEVSWDFDYGTNLQHALALSRSLLAGQKGTRQIILVTDGEPTAHTPPGAREPVFHYPTTAECATETLREVRRCTRDGIRINTFALVDEAGVHLEQFVEQITAINKGRAFYCSPQRLGEYVLVDFLEHRRAQRQPR